MIVPIEMQTTRPMRLSAGDMSTTTRVWDVLMASRAGNLARFQDLTARQEGLLYAQYNYTPPIYFAVRGGHIDLVSFLLAHGALDPDYKTYPFLDTLPTFATERGFSEVGDMLDEYLSDPAGHRCRGDNGEIEYGRTPPEADFERNVNAGDVDAVRRMLAEQPELVHDETYNWGEGILLFAAKSGNWPMLDLLIGHGARVPKISKWARFYYFERTDSAAYLLDHGMDPDHMSWHRVTLLHDMAHANDLEKAELLVRHEANIDAVDDEYLSTPLGFAARWGNADMVQYLIDNGADTDRSGAPWSRPIEWAKSGGHDEIVGILSENLA
ncbi:MAG TPA: ankyrin repeat domain-containing protein [Pyrinomonadaceae bacterium]|nr:ankyrin repeat domain-containing protein [Pyrinomonadaceae bacterium]